MKPSSSVVTLVVLPFVLGCHQSSQGDSVGQGEAGCVDGQAWSFGDPTDPTMQAEFIRFARGLQYLTGANEAATDTVPLPRGDQTEAVQPGPVGTIFPYRSATKMRRADLSRGDGCQGRIIARINIDSEASPNPGVQEAGRRYRVLLDSAIARRRDPILYERVDATAGYKTYPHCHGATVDGSCPAEILHIHSLYPEGESYLWVDNVGEDGWGRAVIVPAQLQLLARVVRIRYCARSEIEQAVEAMSNASAAGAAQAATECWHYDGVEDPHTARAGWIPVPGDDHAWVQCPDDGCCRVDDT